MGGRRIDRLALSSLVEGSEAVFLLLSNDDSDWLVIDGSMWEESKRLPKKVSQNLHAIEVVRRRRNEALIDDGFDQERRAVVPGV